MFTTIVALHIVGGKGINEKTGVYSKVVSYTTFVLACFDGRCITQRDGVVCGVVCSVVCCVVVCVCSVVCSCAVFFMFVALLPAVQSNVDYQYLKS